MLNLTSLLLSSILSKEEQLLLLYQRKMIVEPHTDNTDSESNRSFTRVFNRKLASKNPWDRIFALGKIFSIVKGLQDEKLTVVGQKLVKGVYSKKMADYAYLKR